MLRSRFHSVPGQLVRLEDRNDVFDAVHHLQRLQARFPALVADAGDHGPLFPVDRVDLISERPHGGKDVVDLPRRSPPAS